MSGDLNIQEVISKSTSQVSLADLTRKGVKKVKVLNQASIAQLIAQAVDKAIQDRAAEISASERDKVIQESRRHFEILAKAQAERQESRATEVEAANRRLTTEIEALRVRAEKANEMEKLLGAAAAKLRELDGVASENRALRERLAAKEAEIASHTREAADGRACSAEVAKLREQVAEKDRDVARLEGELSAKDALIAKVMAPSESGDVQAIKDALDALRKSIAGIGSRSGAAASVQDVDPETMLKFVDGGDDQSMKSNFSKVRVDQRQSQGVTGSLAKLKQLNKGA